MVNQTTTDENGTCTITGVKKGSLKINISKEGYQSTTKTINISKNTTLDITLEKTIEEPIEETRNISFTILNKKDNTPINGASVTINDTTKTTGSAGGCTFKNINDGKINVTITKGEYTQNETITVSEESTSFTIQLSVDEEDV